MKKYLLRLVLVLIIFSGSLSLPVTVFADPPDITHTDIFLSGKNNIFTVNFFISWTESSYLINKEGGVENPALSSLTNYLPIYANYIKKHVSLLNNGKDCTLDIIQIPKLTDEEITFGRGVEINGQFNCSEAPGKLLLKNDLLTDVFPTQNNIVNIFENNTDKVSQAALLTGSSQEMVFEVKSNPPQSQQKKTVNGFQVSQINQSLASNLNKVPLAVAVLITFILGILHTLEAGHSKTIITASIIHKKVSLMQGFAYAAIFTVTHIADILLMGGALLIANFFTDIYSKMAYLQLFSLYALLIISFYLLVKNTINFLKHNTDHHHDHGHHDHIGHRHGDHEHPDHQHITNGDFKHQLFVGFLAGIAPCIFGWSIFMIILSTRKVWTVFPIIGAFGLGIFTALVLIVIVVNKLKTGLFDRHQWIGDISPIVSAAILFIYALSQII